MICKTVWIHGWFGSSPSFLTPWQRRGREIPRAMWGSKDWCCCRSFPKELGTWRKILQRIVVVDVVALLTDGPVGPARFGRGFPTEIVGVRSRPWSIPPPPARAFSAPGRRAVGEGRRIACVCAFAYWGFATAAIGVLCFGKCPESPRSPSRVPMPDRPRTTDGLPEQCCAFEPRVWEKNEPWWFWAWWCCCCATCWTAGGSAFAFCSWW